MARIRLLDIAKAADVSVSTVSRVLAEVPGISAEVRERVRSTARRLGYGVRTKRGAGGLKRIVLFGRLVDFGALAGRFPTDVVAGVRDACERRDIELACLPAPGGPVTDGLAATLLEQAETGIIFQSVDDAAFIASVMDLGLPCVGLNTEFPELDSVLPDNETGPAEIAALFFELGHRNAVVLQSSDRPTIRRRVESFTGAFRRLGGAVPEGITLPIVTPAQDIREQIGALSRAHRFTALFCTTDLLAMAAIGALADLAISVPHDVSVTGFDDLLVATLTTPPLTTVRIDRHRLGGLAVRRAIERAEEPEAPATRTILTTTLVRRGSVAAAPAYANVQQEAANANIALT